MSDILQVASQTEEYVGSIERWNADHQAAMHCYKVEETVELGNRVFDAIVAFDEAWRRRVMRGELPFSPVLHSLIRALFQRWHAPCAEVLMAVEELRSQGFSIKEAEEFEHRCQEAAGILTADSEFFDSDKLARLRDEAIDQHHRGETLEC